jgi:hypothetical protein
MTSSCLLRATRGLHNQHPIFISLFWNPTCIIILHHIYFHQPLKSASRMEAMCYDLEDKGLIARAFGFSAGHYS